MSKGEIGIKNLIDLYDVVNSVYHSINTHLHVICIMYNVLIYILCYKQCIISQCNEINQSQAKVTTTDL